MPGGLALDKDGLLYATHMMLHKVSVYDPAGKLVREFGKQGSAPGGFNQPGGIAFGPDGSLHVADQANQRVQRLSPQGEPICAWGKYGRATGEFGGKSHPKGRGGGPHFLAFDSQGDLYTTEASVGRVQKFSPDGKFLLAWGDNEVATGPFWWPQDDAGAARHRGRPQGPGVGDLDKPLTCTSSLRTGALFAGWAERSGTGPIPTAARARVRQPTIFCTSPTGQAQLQDPEAFDLTARRYPPIAQSPRIRPPPLVRSGLPPRSPPMPL